MKIEDYLKGTYKVAGDLDFSAEDKGVVSTQVDAPQDLAEIEDTGDTFKGTEPEEGETPPVKEDSRVTEGEVPPVIEDSKVVEDSKVTEGEVPPVIEDSKVVEEKEVSEDFLLKSLSEKLGREVKSFDEFTEKTVKEDIDPYVKELSDWVKKTNRPIKDWIKFQKDYTKVGDIEVAREFLKLEYPELSLEEIDLEVETKFISSEDDIGNEEALKNLELKKYASRGRKELGKLVSQLDTPSTVNYSKEVQQDLALAKDYKSYQVQSELNNKSYNKIIEQKATGLKTLKMNLAEGVSLDFKLPEGSTKSLINDIQTAPSWKNEDGSWDHEAIVRDTAIVANVESMLKLAFEQGKSSNLDEVMKEVKNSTLTKGKVGNSPPDIHGNGVVIEGFEDFIQDGRVVIGG